MKSIDKHLALFAAALCLGATGLHAEDSAKPAPNNDKPHVEHHENGSKSDDGQKAKLKAAREIAEKDPVVIQAREAAKAAHDKAKETKSEADIHAAREAEADARRAFHSAVIQADPSVAEIAGKTNAGHKERREEKHDKRDERREKHHDRKDIRKEHCEETHDRKDIRKEHREHKNHGKHKGHDENKGHRNAPAGKDKHAAR